jgi:formate dehydrogenase (NADP+) alpha subunit
LPIEPHPSREGRVLHLEIDGRSVSVPEGTTVLRAAEAAGLYVPSLCAHKELTSFGGCRLCVVEIAGMGGYPLACSTFADQGMQVKTDTETLRAVRREVLELILSQHPSSCLICNEKGECQRNQTTIRKAGVSTGCHSCPNDGECELQRVVNGVGITDIDYPIAYRGLEVEHDDPFYDRDYNLCILCGRCVQMCDEVRGASVLSFKYRGRKALIGPAFGNSHIEAGCEFCGACVTVCPTGALADKVSKWDGKPHGIETSTCPFCCLGCQAELAFRNGQLSWARGAYDGEVNDGHLCVRGRFCMPETSHHYSRARKPMLRRGEYFRVTSWDEALAEVAQKLAAAAPDELLMLVSGDLSNEGLFAAQRLMRTGLGANGIDSTARASLPGGPALWSRLFSLPISMKALAEADAVIVAGLDTRYSFSVVGVQVRRAVRRGARFVTVDARESNLVRMADEWLRPNPGDEARALAWLVSALLGAAEPPEPRLSGVGAGAVAAAAQHLESARTLAVVVGPRVFDCAGAEALVSGLEALAGHAGITVLPLVHGANVRGALELGALAGVLPGPQPAQDGGLTLAQLRAGRRPKVLYLVGETLFTTRPDCDFVIAQDLYLPPFEVDAFLPAASFAEAKGTLTNIEGRVQELRQVEHLPAGAVHGFATPDWKIFSDLAGRLRHPELQYADAAAVRAAIRAELRGFPAYLDRLPRPMTPMAAPAETTGAAPEGKGRFVLVPEQPAFRHRGIDLAGVVEGLGDLHVEEGLRMSPDDMASLGVEPGATVTVSQDGFALALPARPDPGCPKGAVYVSRFEPWSGPTRPTRVRVSVGDRSRAARPAKRAQAATGKPSRARARTGGRSGAATGGARGPDR